MALEKAEIKAGYPLPSYCYQVTVMTDGGDADLLGCSEVSGLKLTYDPVIYRHGLSYATGMHIIPGMRQPVKLTLKRGVAPGQSYLKDWLQETFEDPGSDKVHRDLVIDLCDEAAVPVVRWTVSGAMPTSIDAPAFSASSNEVSFESLELTANDLRIEFDP